MQTTPSTTSSAPQMPPSAQVEVSALNKITWYAILQLANMVVSVALFIWIYANLIIPLLGNIAIGQPPTNLLNLFRGIFPDLIVFMAIGLVITLASLLYLWAGFRSLSSIDKANFSLPTTMMLIMIVGGLIVAGTVLPYYGLFFIQFLQQSGGVFPVGAISTVIFTLFLSLLTLAGGLLALAGAIGGMVLGLWRVGIRYNETIIKVGAIFTIIPFLNYVAPILIIVGVRSCIGRIRSLT